MVNRIKSLPNAYQRARQRQMWDQDNRDALWRIFAAILVHKSRSIASQICLQLYCVTSDESKI